MTNSEVRIRKGSMSFIGYDAVKLHQAMTLRSALKLYARTGIIPFRGANPLTGMLQVATQFTKKKYRRSKQGAQEAADDMHQWVEAMKAAMPITYEAT